MGLETLIVFVVAVTLGFLLGVSMARPAPPTHVVWTQAREFGERIGYQMGWDDAHKAFQNGKAELEF